MKYFRQNLHCLFVFRASHTCLFPNRLLLIYFNSTIASQSNFLVIVLHVLALIFSVYGYPYVLIAGYMVNQFNTTYLVPFYYAVKTAFWIIFFSVSFMNIFRIFANVFIGFQHFEHRIIAMCHYHGLFVSLLYF